MKKYKVGIDMHLLCPDIKHIYVSIFVQVWSSHNFASHSKLRWNFVLKRSCRAEFKRSSWQIKLASTMNTKIIHSFHFMIRGMHLFIFLCGLWVCEWKKASNHHHPSHACITSQKLNRNWSMNGFFFFDKRRRNSNSDVWGYKC